jgi:hypothetical protein
MIMYDAKYKRNGAVPKNEPAEWSDDVIKRLSDDEKTTSLRAQ